MKIIIENCNNTDIATIDIAENCLNIKHAPNGTGKSTIAKAIQLRTENNGDLKDLKPFKFRGVPETSENKSKITGAHDINSVAVFNEEYISQFVFQQDEVLSNSFEIFIQNESFIKQSKDIANSIEDIQRTFKDNADICTLIDVLNSLIAGFGKSKEGYATSSAIGKGIAKGNNIENIPENLKSYTPFLKSESNVKWLKWQIQGKEFLDISEECPYCIAPTTGSKETILRVSQEYDAKTVEHLNNIINILEELGEYFSPDTKAKLDSITRNKATISKEEKTYLNGVKDQADTLREKLQDLRNLSFFDLKEKECVKQAITSLKIDMELLHFLKSEKTLQVVNVVNETLDKVIQKAGQLQGAVAQQKRGIEKTIHEHEQDINEFLKNAGYKYQVTIEETQNQSYQMKLTHKDMVGSVQNGRQHLSYGEKNAFALVLFMYEVLKNEPDLIILDDPISSFDRTKKFAIIEKLFRGQNSLQNKTVLMMTHDFEPIIDMVYNLSHYFEKISASFLKNTNGIITEIPITKGDIKSFGEICADIVASNKATVIKLIYLRRQLEIEGNKGVVYNLISSLLKKRNTPNKKEQGDFIDLSQQEIDLATNSIRQSGLVDFDYQTTLQDLNNREKLKKTYDNSDSNYEKLQIYRIIDKSHSNLIVKKYIDETFHIENDYVMQLDPSVYETVPAHIIEECDATLLTVPTISPVS